MKIIFRNNTEGADTEHKGLLIAICGFDGAGKTTQIYALKSYLEEKNYSVCITKQPTEWYRKDPFVRNFLKHGGSQSQAQTLALFAAADRQRHIDEVITPALNRGDIVLTDRYVFSSLAYFQFRGVSSDFVAYINQGIPKPHFSFFLDVTPDLLMERIKLREQEHLKFEENSSEKISKIRDIFLSLKDYLILIDGEMSEAQVTAEIIKTVKL